MSYDRAAAESEQTRRDGIMSKTTRIAAATMASLIFAGLMAGGIAFLHMRANAEKAPGLHPPVTVETTVFSVQQGYAESLQYVGRLEAARRTALAFERAGLVMDVAVDEGDPVMSGQAIATLDVERLQAGRLQLLAQKSEFEARRKLARLTLDRQSRLRSEGWSAEQSLDEAEAALAGVTASIERIDAEIGALDIDIRKSLLRAPFDGTVSERLIDEGAVVDAGAPVLTLLESSRRQARIGLPPEVAEKLETRRVYTLRSGAQTFSGTLAATRPDIQPGTRTASVLFDLTGADRAPFGEIVTLEIETDIPVEGGWLPLTALKEGQRGLWTVMTVEDRQGEKVVRSESVEILHADNQSVYVRGTLSDGARVISNGGNRVTDGQRIALGTE